MKNLITTCLIFLLPFPLVALAQDLQIYDDYLPSLSDSYKKKDSKYQKYEAQKKAPSNKLTA